MELANGTARRATHDSRYAVKHHLHLQHLIHVLQQVNLQRVPTLIIDDEGDQAGLNTLVNQGEESTTYRRLLTLKRCFPHHSYLQYTATPQAPLLISIVDVLSPSFDSSSGRATDMSVAPSFFLNGPQVGAYPAAQIHREQPLECAPPTLLQAMRSFFTGVAIGYITGSPNQMLYDGASLAENRSAPPIPYVGDGGSRSLASGYGPA